jgi:hypothetical protein
MSSANGPGNGSRPVDDRPRTRARRRSFFALRQFWRRALLVVFLVASIIGGYQLFEHGKPVDPGDLDNLTPNYTIAVYVSNPLANVYLSLRSYLPSEYAATDPDSTNLLTVTVRPPLNTVVRYIIVIDPVSAYAEVSTAQFNSLAGTPIAHGVISYNGGGTIRPLRRLDADFVGEVSGTYSDPQSTVTRAFYLASGNTTHDGALDVEMPIVEPGYLSGKLAMTGEQCGNVATYSVPRYTVTQAAAAIGTDTDYCRSEHETTQSYYYPAINSNGESQAGLLGTYQLLTAQPSENQIANDSITWTGTGQINPSFAAVLPGTADQRSTYTFLAGIALAVTGGTAIALIQEIRDSEKPKQEDQAPKPPEPQSTA